MRAGLRGHTSLRQQTQPEILRDVGVLIFVHQDEFETVLVLTRDFRVLAKQPDAFQQQIAEVGGVESFQPILKGLIEFLAAAFGEGRAFARRNVLGCEPAIFPMIDHAGEHARGPALVVDVLGRQNLLEQADLVVDIENGEIGFQAYQLGVAAQNLHADGVESTEPRHAFHHLADHVANALLHLARGLVGEGDGEDFARAGAAGREDVRDAGGQHARLTSAGAGQHEDRTVERFHRATLLGVEIGQIGGAAGQRARGNARRRWRRKISRFKRFAFCWISHERLSP